MPVALFLFLIGTSEKMGCVGGRISITQLKSCHNLFFMCITQGQVSQCLQNLELSLKVQRVPLPATAELG